MPFWNSGALASPTTRKSAGVDALVPNPAPLAAKGSVPDSPSGSVTNSSSSLVDFTWSESISPVPVIHRLETVAAKKALAKAGAGTPGVGKDAVASSTPARDALRHSNPDLQKSTTASSGSWLWGFGGGSTRKPPAKPNANAFVTASPTPKHATIGLHPSAGQALDRVSILTAFGVAHPAHPPAQATTPQRGPAGKPSAVQTARKPPVPAAAADEDHDDPPSPDWTWSELCSVVPTIPSPTKPAAKSKQAKPSAPSPTSILQTPAAGTSPVSSATSPSSSVRFHPSVDKHAGPHVHGPKRPSGPFVNTAPSPLGRNPAVFVKSPHPNAAAGGRVAEPWSPVEKAGKTEGEVVEAAVGWEAVMVPVSILVVSLAVVLYLLLGSSERLFDD
ncbi:hypothetical protein HDU96_001569 [Phlyctochytrium bullatum]|nr:hypothetical protein HDU96_001569 [Phlyctochytrium bullatum]